MAVRPMRRPIVHKETAVPDVENAPAEQESKYHSYASIRIPWYVHLIWILFWCMVVYYVVRYLAPSVETELLNPS
jgi:hypothetical protein